MKKTKTRKIWDFAFILLCFSVLFYTWSKTNLDIYYPGGEFFAPSDPQKGVEWRRAISEAKSSVPSNNILSIINTISITGILCSLSILIIFKISDIEKSKLETLISKQNIRVYGILASIFLLIISIILFIYSQNQISTFSPIDLLIKEKRTSHNNMIVLKSVSAGLFVISLWLTSSFYNVKQMIATEDKNDKPRDTNT